MPNVLGISPKSGPWFLGTVTKNLKGPTEYLTSDIQIAILMLSKEVEECGLVITRETDYALRILRALTDGDLHTVGQIAQSEMLPQAFAYKILQKLAKAGLIDVTRGTTGGCRLAADLSKVSLYDLMMITGERSDLNACMDGQFQCAYRDCHGACRVHASLMEIQRKLDAELHQHSLQEILTGS